MTKAARVSPQDVRLVPGRGSGSAVEQYWHIYVDTRRVGKVFITRATDAFLGVHHSIQIFLNQREQGNGIGRVGYRLACMASGYATIYAHMRKTNIASLCAAEKAGFVVCNDTADRQRTMVWHRPR